MNKIEMTDVFGWNVEAWSRPFLSALADFPLREPADILEIGAGSYSAVGLFFRGRGNRVNVTTYPEANVPGLQALVQRQGGADAGEVRVGCMSAREVTGRYDLVVMKSVLGGLFREGSGSSAEANALLARIVATNLKPGGLLVTLDNGATAIEPLFARFGARANRWRYFTPGDFTGYARQYGFGLLSSFSLVTRLGRAGRPIEHLLYLLDAAIFRLVRIARPSVIVTVYRS